MNKFNYIAIGLLLSSVLVADNLKPNYSFSNISVNYLDWTSNTQNRSAQKDFSYLELEGGAGWDFGDFYMFLDIENPTKNYGDKPADNLRFTMKPVIDVKIVDKLSFHIQDYYLKSKEFYVSNLVFGLSYKIQTDFGLWIKPFIGLHHQTSTFYSGMNGYMVGWVFDYQFKIKNLKFSIDQWHEQTFARDEKDGYEHQNGTQGAFSFWWHPLDDIATGISYRYADKQLGFKGYQAGYIYSLRYDF